MGGEPMTRQRLDSFRISTRGAYLRSKNKARDDRGEIHFIQHVLSIAPPSAPYLRHTAWRGNSFFVQPQLDIGIQIGTLFFYEAGFSTPDGLVMLGESVSGTSTIAYAHRFANHAWATRTTFPITLGAPRPSTQTPTGGMVFASVNGDNALFTYDSAGDFWTRLPDLADPALQDCPLCSTDQHVYVIGGQTFDYVPGWGIFQTVSTVWRMTFSGGAQTVFNTLVVPTIHGYPSAHTAENKLQLSWGGTTDTGFFLWQDINQTCNIPAQSWISNTSYPVGSNWTNESLQINAPQSNSVSAIFGKLDPSKLLLWTWPTGAWTNLGEPFDWLLSYPANDPNRVFFRQVLRLGLP